MAHVSSRLCILTASLIISFCTALIPAIAPAQVIPPYASAQGIPPYATASSEQVHGTIASINGTWNISIDDVNGYVDNVELRQGTIINPTGLTLEPGMSATILGYTDGNRFDAIEIDTPYRYGGPRPTAIYYGPGWWYPGFAYGYGPSFSLVIGSGATVIRAAWGGHWWVPRPAPPLPIAYYQAGWARPVPNDRVWSAAPRRPVDVQRWPAYARRSPYDYHPDGGHYYHGGGHDRH